MTFKLTVPDFISCLFSKLSPGLTLALKPFHRFGCGPICTPNFPLIHSHLYSSTCISNCYWTWSWSSPNYWNDPEPALRMKLKSKLANPHQLRQCIYNELFVTAFHEKQGVPVLKIITLCYFLWFFPVYTELLDLPWSDRHEHPFDYIIKMENCSKTHQPSKKDLTFIWNS